MTDIDEIIQLMRTLTLAQIRKQLEEDKRLMPKRLARVQSFFKAAKEKR